MGYSIEHQIQQRKQAFNKKCGKELSRLNQSADDLNIDLEEKLSLLRSLDPKSCYVFFNAFTPMDMVPSREDLVHCFRRSTTIICKRNQKEVDLAIPVLTGKEVDKQTMTMILVQVKNGVDRDCMLSSTVKITPDGMDMMQEDYLPYIALYMGFFADEGVEVPIKTYATRSNRKDPLANQIPIALYGLSSNLYPCLTSKNNVVITQRIENNMDGYSILA